MGLPSTMPLLTRTVWTLSLISLVTDVASEMLYPVMPIYLKSIGFSIVWIGMLEGLAEATAGLSKGYFGRWSDVTQRRAPFVQAGYALSALAKPLTVLFAQPLWVFACRTVERLGKGLRTGARDAMLSAETDAANKGAVFGFHRAMDTLGAALGPALALVYLALRPGAYRDLFLFALLPGIAAIVLSLLLRDKPAAAVIAPRPRLLDFVHYFRSAGANYRNTVAGLLIFALFNSSDVFLLLVMKQRGFSDSKVIAIYIFYNLVYALAAYPAGRLADRIGLKKTFLGGLILFALVYAAIAFTHELWLLVSLFFIYGLYAAFTEGVSKAWITNICRPEHAATAVGTYTAFSSVAAMIASSLAGFIWMSYSATAALLLAAAGSLVACAWLYYRANSSDSVPDKVGRQ